VIPSPPLWHRVVLAALLSVALCGVAAAGSVKVADGPLGTGGIAGIVFDADGLIPVAGISISAEPYAGGAGPVTLSDAEGRYALDGLTPGYYVVRAQGTASWATQYYHRTRERNLAAPVQVLADGAVTAIHFYLQPIGAISGRVYAAAGGAPLADVLVAAGGYDGPLPGVQARTAADGSYTLAEVAVGAYRLAAYGPPGYLTEYYRDAQVAALATRVIVTQGLTTAEIDMPLDAAPAISGHVYAAADGTPLAGIQISAQPLSGGGTPAITRSAADGSYTLGPLAAGSYHLQAWGDDIYVTKFHANACTATSATPINLTPGGSVTVVDFRLERVGSITGVVRGPGGAPLADVWVAAAQTGDALCGDGGLSRADGSYTIFRLWPGTYHVWTDPDTYAPQYYDHLYDATLATPVTVTAGLTTTGIVFDLEPAGAIAGRVYLPDGATPAQGIWVAAERAAGAGLTVVAQTNRTGAYTLEPLAPGAYRVRANAQGDYATTYHPNTTTSTEAALVTVAISQTVPGVDITLIPKVAPPPGGIAGRVLAADTLEPLEGITVTASVSLNPRGATHTDAAGDFMLGNLAPGYYLLRADGNALYAYEYYAGTRVSQLGTSVQVTAGLTTTGIVFTLDRIGAIAGRVTRSNDGAPAAGVLLQAEPYDGACCRRTATTGADGRYTLEGLTPEDHRVWTQDSRYVPEWYEDASEAARARRVPVAAGETTPGVDLAIEPLGLLSGHVYASDGVLPLAHVLVRARPALGGDDLVAETGPDGAYTLGLRAGAYRVAVLDTGIFRDAWYNGATTQDAASLVTVAAGAERGGVDFRLTVREGGALVGRVVAAATQLPLADVVIWASPYDGAGQERSVAVSADGRYILGPLQPGQYRVEARPPTGSAYAPEYYHETPIFAAATRVAVSLGATRGGIDFTLDSTAAINGRVRSADGGAPLAGIMVRGAPYDDTCCEVSALTAADGSYALTGLALGNYRVWTDGSAAFAHEYYRATRDRAAAEPVAVTSGETVAGIDLTLEQRGGISGHVHADDGATLLRGATVIAAPSRGGCCRGQATTDADGAYTISGLAPEDYAVRVMTFGEYTGEYYRDVPLNAPSEATPVTVAPGATTPGITFDLLRVILPWRVAIPLMHR